MKKKKNTFLPQFYFLRDFFFPFMMTAVLITVLIKHHHLFKPLYKIVWGKRKKKSTTYASYDLNASILVVHLIVTLSPYSIMQIVNNVSEE